VESDSSLIFLLCSFFDIAANVKLTYVYWGSPAEDVAIRKALKDFEIAHPGISVEPMYISGDISGMEFLLLSINLPMQ
jgi:multiple sugar transport system substrate-binding protein